MFWTRTFELRGYPIDDIIHTIKHAFISFTYYTVQCLPFNHHCRVIVIIVTSIIIIIITIACCCPHSNCWRSSLAQVARQCRASSMICSVWAAVAAGCTASCGAGTAGRQAGGGAHVSLAGVKASEEGVARRRLQAR